MPSNKKSLVERQLKNAIKKIIKEILKENTENTVLKITDEIITQIKGYEDAYTILFNNLNNLIKYLNNKRLEFEKEEKNTKAERNERNRKGQVTQQDQDLLDNHYQILKFLQETNKLAEIVSEYKLAEGYTKNIINKINKVVNNSLNLQKSQGLTGVSRFIFEKGPESLFTIIRLFFAQKRDFDENGDVKNAINQFNDAKQKFDEVAKKFQSKFEDYNPNLEIVGSANQILLSLTQITEKFVELSKQSSESINPEKVRTEPSKFELGLGAMPKGDAKYYKYFEQIKR